MGRRVCKVCGIEKDYVYLCLNGQGRATYKDQHGNIWHSRTCYDCFKGYIKTTNYALGKQKPLKVVNCTSCNKEFQQKTIKQFSCSKECYNKLD